MEIDRMTDCPECSKPLFYELSNDSMACTCGYRSPEPPVSARPPPIPEPAPCCDKFAHARLTGSDPEGYGCAIGWWDGEFHVGSMLDDPIDFCPWCGVGKL
jgi:hypothetical protein